MSIQATTNPAGTSTPTGQNPTTQNPTTQSPTGQNPVASSAAVQNPTAQNGATSSPGVTRRPVWKHGVAAAVGASAATTALAAAASAAGVTFGDRTGASIPLAAFAQLTLIFSFVGVGLAAVLARKARRPRPAFVRTTAVLTVLSFVPDLMVGFDVASAATLITLHIVAAAIVVPTLARRLARTR